MEQRVQIQDVNRLWKPQGGMGLTLLLFPSGQGLRKSSGSDMLSLWWPLYIPLCFLGSCECLGVELEREVPHREIRGVIS